MNTLKTNVSIAYSKIHDELMYDEPFSEIVERFYFPTKKELNRYSGVYEGANDPSNTIQLISKEYYLTDARSGGGFKLIKVNNNKFVASYNTKGSYIEFIEDENGIINAFNLSLITEKDTISAHYKKVD
jgi:predicted nucleic-acid-binding Zn-ribbon protein